MTSLAVAAACQPSPGSQIVSVLWFSFDGFSLGDASLLPFGGGNGPDDLNPYVDAVSRRLHDGGARGPCGGMLFPNSRGY